MASVHSSPGEIPDTQYFVPEQRGKKPLTFSPHSLLQKHMHLKKKTKTKTLNSHMEAKVGVHQILHLQPPADVTSNMQFKTKLAHQR